MITTLLALLSIFFPAPRVFPSQAMLDTDLKLAETAWGKHAEIRSISLAPIGGDCTVSAWSDLASRDITVNSLNACRWDAKLLAVTIEHEYGHMLLGFPHSEDKHSVMYFRPHRVGQRITKEDRARIENEASE